MTMPPLPELFVAVNLPVRDRQAMHAWAKGYGQACAAAATEHAAAKCDALWEQSEYGPTAHGIAKCAAAIRGQS
jgi:hypothetical protein